MSANPTSVANQALSHLGVGVTISNVVTDQTPEARAARTFLEDALYATLKDYKWPWAKKSAALALVEEDPSNGWSYSYRYPVDCLDIRAVEDEFDLDPGTIQKKPSPYDTGHDNTGLLIYSNIPDALITYTPKMSNYTFFPSNFILAISFRLAAYIAPRLTKGDPFKLGIRAMQMYQLEIGKASANSFNETKNSAPPVPDMIAIRNS